VVQTRLGVEDVGRECGLAIRSGWHRPRRAPGAERRLAEVASRVLTTLELSWNGRHSDRDVLGKQGDELVHVSGLEGSGDADHNLVFSGGVGRGGRLVILSADQVIVYSRPSAFEGAFD
jgi:hypothetical protein